MGGSISALSNFVKHPNQQWKRILLNSLTLKIVIYVELKYQLTTIQNQLCYSWPAVLCPDEQVYYMIPGETLIKTIKQIRFF